jgi:nitrogen-specific signal transduction histidine kinase
MIHASSAALADPLFRQAGGRFRSASLYVLLDESLRVALANQAFDRTFQVTRREVAQQLLSNLCGGGWNIPELRRLVKQGLPDDSIVTDFSVKGHFPGVGRKELRLNARRLDQKAGLPARILLAMQVVEGVPDVPLERESICAGSVRLES